MLSLAEIRALVPLLEPLVLDRRVQRVVQPDEHTLVLELYGRGEGEDSGAKLWLVMSTHPKFGRISTRSEAPPAPSFPPDFAQWVKAHCHRAFIKGIRVVNDDRQVGLLLKGKQGEFELLLSLMGTRSNLFALDSEGRIQHTLRPLTTTRADLRMGDVYTNPEKHEALAESSSRWPALQGEHLLKAIQTRYEALETRRDYDELRDSIEKALDKELDFARRKAEKLHQDLNDAKDAREKKRHGELLKQVMSNLKPGETHVVVRDYETEEDVKIELDPKLTPAENLERYFKRYHKGLVGTNMLGQQLEIVQTHISELEQLNTELIGVTDMPALSEFAERPVVKELRQKHFPEQFKPSRPPKKLPTKKDVPGRMLPRRYATSDGLEVWVGKSDEGNDYLTTKLAAGNDLFFHVEGYPGSHTILRTGGRKDPPPQSLLEAAELCVHFSKLKNAKAVDVHLAPIKHVHKPKGAKPGLVYVNHGRTVALRRDPKRLERILKAQIKEDE